MMCTLLQGSGSNDGMVYRVTLMCWGRSEHLTQEIDAFGVGLMSKILVKRVGEILGKSKAWIGGCFSPTWRGACALERRQCGLVRWGRYEAAQRA